MASSDVSCALKLSKSHHRMAARLKIKERNVVSIDCFERHEKSPKRCKDVVKTTKTMFHSSPVHSTPIEDPSIGKSMVFDGLKPLKSIEKQTLFLILGHSQK